MPNMRKGSCVADAPLHHEQPGNQAGVEAVSKTVSGGAATCTRAAMFGGLPENIDLARRIKVAVPNINEVITVSFGCTAIEAE